MQRAYITGVGHYLPPRVVTNADLPASLDADPEWVVKRTGIHERRWIDEGTYTSDLATEASKAALQDAGLVPEDVDCIIGATLSPNHAFPGIGVYVQRDLELKSIPAYDIRNQCSGFLYGLSVARALVASGQHRNIILACAEVHSTALGLTPMHRHITPLFGDGGGAVIVSAEPRGPRTMSIDDIQVHADGRGADKLRQRVWDVSMPHFVRGFEARGISLEEALHCEMDGQYIFRRAVSGMAGVAGEVLAKAGLGIGDVDWVLPHQANLNINKTVASVLKLPPEKMLSNIQTRGNTTAASIPILLSENAAEGRFTSGQRLLSVAFGAGLTWGAALLTVQ